MGCKRLSAFILWSCALFGRNFIIGNNDSSIFRPHSCIVSSVVGDEMD